MRNLLFILLVAVIGVKLCSGYGMERQVAGMPAGAAVVPDEEHHARQLAYKVLENALDFSICCDEMAQSVSHQFNVSQRLLLRIVQGNSQLANKMQAKDLIRYIHHQTAVGESSCEVSYCIGRTGGQSLYVYAIRHLLI